MGRETPSPAARPIGLPPVPDHATATPADEAHIPWIDTHQHTQALTWNVREAFDISGCYAAVMIAASYYWAPYRPVKPADVRFLWDDAIRRATTFDRSHFYDQYLAVGIHTWSYVEDHGVLLDALPDYCALDRVRAIGETGIESQQHTVEWPLEGQRAAVAGQMDVARRTGLPVIVHTPGSTKGHLPTHLAARYEEDNASFTDPLLPTEGTKRAAVELDIEIADRVGLPDDQVIIDHADSTVVSTVLENTDCYLGFTMSSTLRANDVGDIVETVERYGPDRIFIDCDLAGVGKDDPFTMRRVILELLHRGMDPETIRTLVFDNPRQVFDIA